MAVDALVVVLVLLFAGALPFWPYSRRWGYSGAGGIGLLLLLVLLMHVENVI